MFGSMVYRIQEPAPDPEIDKRQDAAIGDRLDQSRPYVVSHARAMLEEIREPSGLHDPHEGNFEHTAGDGNRRIGSGYRRHGLEAF